MNTFPSPTTHGAWRVIDGQLVDESQQPPAREEANTAAPSLDAQNAPSTDTTARRKAPSKAP